jgi:hypothetical protein
MWHLTKLILEPVTLKDLLERYLTRIFLVSLESVNYRELIIWFITTMNIDEIIRANKHFKESRLPSLYSDFERLKLLNPEGYEANIEAWTNLLLEIIKHYKDNDSRVSIPTVNPDLKQILSIPIQGKPRSLNLILQELVSRKFLVPYSHYISVDIPYFGIIDNSLSIYNRIKLYLNGVQFTPNERYLSWDLTCQLGNKMLSLYSRRGGLDIRVNYTMKRRSIRFWKQRFRAYHI